MLRVVERLYLVYPQSVRALIHRRPVLTGLEMVSVLIASTRQLKRDSTAQDLAIFVKKLLKNY